MRFDLSHVSAYWNITSADINRYITVVY